MIRYYPRLEVSTTGVIAVAAGATSATPGLWAVDSMRVTWGRGKLTDTAATPAQATVTVLDRSPGLTLARRQDLSSKLVRLSYTTDPAGLGAAVAVLFYGRITSVRTAPAGRDPLVDGWLVTVTAASLEVDLANVRPGGVWPAETFGARADRMAALLPSTMRGPALPTRFDVGLPSGPDPAVDPLMSNPCAQLDVGTTDLLTLYRQFYASLSGFPLVFDPGVPQLTYAAFPRSAYISQLGGTFSAGLATTPDSAGSYRVCAGGTSGLGLDGGRTGYPRAAGLQQSPDQSVTRIEVHWRDPAAGYQQATAGLSVGPWKQVVTGVTAARTWAIDTVHAAAANASQLAGWLQTIVEAELALPALDKLQFDTGREPFQSAAHGRWLLSTVQTGTPAYLNGSYLPLLGVRPMVALIGGTLTYKAGEWTVDAQPALVPRLAPPAPLGYAPLRVADVDPARAVRLRDVDRCVRIGDLRFLDIAAGAIGGTPYPGNPT